MTTHYSDLVNTTEHPDRCTSCGVYQDNSAYWTPALYFQHANGTFEIVDQVGGMLAYYLMYLEHVKAFPEGFRMIAGDPWIRNFTGPVPDVQLSDWPTDPTDQFWLQQRAIGFNCLNYDKTPEPSLYRHTLPTKDYLDEYCKDGIRIELAFPSCGKEGELDSPDHKSHVAWPSLVKEGNCPEGFDVHYPFLFFESIWATNNYAGVDGQFVLSYGDPVGTGYHGDFIMGWESKDFLQAAVDQCTNPSGQVSDCPLFKLKPDSDAEKCTFDMPEALKDEDVTGPCDSLPIGVPIQPSGPQATPYPVVGQTGGPKSYSPPSSTSSVPVYSGQDAPSYSAAEYSLTATAPGGIVVAKYSSGADTSSSSATASSGYFSAPSASITASPSLSDAASSQDDIIATSYMTQGNEVVELFIEEVDVTVTATATPSAGNYRRHLQRHQHHHQGVHH